MNEKQIKLAVSALLHDIGKIACRKGSGGAKHAAGGAEYLKGLGITDPDILNGVQYHHETALSDASIPDDSFAYIVCMANVIAAAVDKRDAEENVEGFDMDAPLKPVFNILNGNSLNMYYSPKLWNVEDGINYPGEKKEAFSEEEYSGILKLIQENLQSMEMTQDYLNSLLEVLETSLSFVPSGSPDSEQADISLFDHCKVTAAAAACIYQYLGNDTNYRQRLYTEAEKFRETNAFLLGSLDFTGIQKFIYTIASKNALKTLRSRSFYLELMMEHIIDQLLERTGLCRANLIYSGGGHCYLLLPNTDEVKEAFDDFLAEQNEWLLDQYQTALYLAGGYAECSASTLRNIPSGSYAAIYRKVSEVISDRKASRYSAGQIRMLNRREVEDYTRECKVCRSIGKVNADNVCPSCLAIQGLSKDVLYQDLFVVDSEPTGLKLPGELFLSAMKKEQFGTLYGGDKTPVRVYGKNIQHIGKQQSSRLWVGEYSCGLTLEQMAKSYSGMNDKIAILRADVDNLGQSFVAGFKNPANQDRFVTLSRTASLSRQLSLFFKLHINKILANPQFTVTGEKKDYRVATVVYSGGDDLFIVGQWLDVIELAVDIRRAFSAFSEGALTISGGIGIYDKSYPFNVIAEEVAEMEEKSKDLPGKNAVTLLEDGEEHPEDGKNVSDGTYHWEELENEVIGEKLRVIAAFFDGTDDYGNSFLYRLLELIRNQNEKINFARLIYLLSRMEPDKKKKPELYSGYMEFRNDILRWIHEDKSIRQLKTAIMIYVYMHRQKEE